jgi:tetratricopeptide (TPR) repeat protein
VFRVLRLDEIDAIPVAGVNMHPLRRALGITGFGINGWSAEAGQQLIEEHDETGTGAGRHQELYVVIAGHARFRVDGETIEAPPGTLVYVPDVGSRRSAIATADGTLVLAIGGEEGTVIPSAFEHYFVAHASVDAGDPQGAYDTAAAGLADHPDNASLHYNLACYAALAGDADRALEHLARAFELDPQTCDWAAADADLDAIRSDPRYPVPPQEDD